MLDAADGGSGDLLSSPHPSAPQMDLLPAAVARSVHKTLAAGSKVTKGHDVPLP